MAAMMEATRSHEGSSSAGGSNSHSGSGSISVSASGRTSAILDAMKRDSPNGVHDTSLGISAPLAPTRSYSPSRPPTSAEIDAVIAAAMANAPVMQHEPSLDMLPNRAVTPLMTNLLPSAVGMDGRVNLFVGNLPYRVRWQDLKDLFRKAGTVLRADVSLGPDNRSRGYGTVLMGSREDAARAIDRFNGYTWQTRTLEVRPDRLPPEYEPQPHPMFGRNGPNQMNVHQMNGMPHQPFPHPPHLVPNHSGMGPGQGGWNNQRPGGAPMYHQGVSPHPPPPPPAPHLLPPTTHSQSQSPAPPQHANSPPSLFGPLPIVRDPSITFPLAASPLAGALSGTSPSSGVLPEPLPVHNSGRRESLTPSTSLTGIAPRTISPGPGLSGANGIPRAHPSFSNTQRPTLDQINTFKPPSEPLSSSRAPPPGSLGPLPPPLFGTQPMGRASPPENGITGDEKVRRTSLVGDHLPAQMEGLAHQGAGLGPPSNLHDRVVFVSNDLKDLLRPAGTIIRADVAQDENRRPRGFGTALFATEGDATRAVEMLNGRELGGRQIRVYLEKDSHVAHHPQHPFASPPMRPADLPSAADRSEANDSSMSPIGGRLPWSINTSLSRTPQRPSSYSPNEFSPVQPTPGPNFRAHHHPGPISMPSFQPLDTPTQFSNPLSPLQRGPPPMTPSMPGFVFNAFPDTPPLHHFLSPLAVGPFSPGIPLTSPTGGYPYNPFLNPAPGAPVDRFQPNLQNGMNGMNGNINGNGNGNGNNTMPTGSAALGTPTTTGFPPGNFIHGFGPPGSSPSIMSPIGGSHGMFRNGNSQSSNGNGSESGGMMSGQDYFPYIPNRANSETPIRSRHPSSASTLPLNARDRLAASSIMSTIQPDINSNSDNGSSLDTNGFNISGPNEASDDIDLEGRLNGLHVDSPNTTPTKSRGQTDNLGSPEKKNHLDREKDSSHLNANSDERAGRQSLDGARPSFSAAVAGSGIRGNGETVSAPGERRASFGDSGM